MTGSAAIGASAGDSSTAGNSIGAGRIAVYAGSGSMDGGIAIVGVGRAAGTGCGVVGGTYWAISTGASAAGSAIAWGVGVTGSSA